MCVWRRILCLCPLAWIAHFAVNLSLAEETNWIRAPLVTHATQPVADGALTDSVQSDSTNSSGTGEVLEGDEGLLDLDFAQLRQTSLAPALEEIVTTVSRQRSTVGRSPAAVFVISREMIRRAGATSLPEALRMAPGVEVARINGNQWAVSIRGLNNHFSRSLLVQIDGRSVYSPLFGGVFWDAQDVLLEDVERIEVIRGPGATVWGANAVNGVINIITRSAEDSTGVYVSAGGGTEERGFSAARVGGTAACGQIHWRAWGKWFDRDHLFDTQPAFDDWRQGRGGGRLDWATSDQDLLTVQGEYYQGRSGVYANPGPTFAPLAADTTIDGGHIMSRWTRTLSDSSDMALQVYFDRADRGGYPISAQTDTLDFDFQHHTPWRCRHDIVWGMRYRHIENVTSQSSSIALFAPTRRNTDLFSAFLQDEITLVEDRLFLTLGTKMEKNDFTDFEIQPSGRLLWVRSPKQVFWGAVSRAVRTPSLGDEDVILNVAPGTSVLGSNTLDSEELIAYELGMRTQPQPWFNWDLSLFYNVYDDLITTVPEGANLRQANVVGGEAYGVEWFGKLQPTACWTVSGSYTFLQLHTHTIPGASPGAPFGEGASPQNQVYLRSSWDLGCNWEYDLIARYVDHLRADNIASYTTLDTRLSWRPWDGWQVEVVGQNLLDSQRAEYGDDFLNLRATQVRRGVYGRVSWRY